MSPFDLIVWALAGAVSIFLIGVSVAVVVSMVKNLRK